MDSKIEKYVELTVLHGNLIEEGNKKANKIHSEIEKELFFIRVTKNETKTEFYKLLEHENPSVKLWTATELLSTNELRSLKILESLTKEKNIIGLTAKTIIEMWRKGMIIKINWEDNLNKK